MSEHPTDPAVEPVEIAQSAVESTPDVPWSAEEYDRERAYNTLQHVRAELKEAESKAREFERLQKDESAFRDFVSQRGYEIPDDEPDEPEFDLAEDPTADLRKTVDELRQWREQREANEAVDRFQSDVTQRAEKAGIELDDADRELLFVKSLNAGFTQDAIDKAFTDLAARNEAREKAAIERYLNSKRAPTPPQAGKAGEQSFDPLDRKQRLAHLEAAYAADEQA